MGSKHEIQLDVNGEQVRSETAGRTSLADFLRDELRPHRHAPRAASTASAAPARCCSTAQPVRSCIVLAAQADGQAITTIEGLAGPDGELNPVQEAFCDSHALQCGFCTPGMVLAVQALLDNVPDPTPEQTSTRRSAETSAAAPATSRSARPSPSSAGTHRTRRRDRGQRGAPMTLQDDKQLTEPIPQEPRHRYLSQPARVREDRRFVDRQRTLRRGPRHRPGTLHVGLVTSPHAHARIVDIDVEQALAVPTASWRSSPGRSWPRRPSRCGSTSTSPRSQWRPLAVESTPLRRRVDRSRRRRVAGRGGGRRRAGRPSTTTRCPFVMDPEEAATTAPRSYTRAMAPTSWQTASFAWGDVDGDLARADKHDHRAHPLEPQLDGAARNLRRHRLVGPAPRPARRVGLDPDAAVPRPGRRSAADPLEPGAGALRRRRRRQLRSQARDQARRTRRAPGPPTRRAR